jgi:hypothetical protein
MIESCITDILQFIEKLKIIGFRMAADNIKLLLYFFIVLNSNVIHQNILNTTV